MSEDRRMGILTAIAGLAMIVFSGPLARLQVRQLEFMVSERGQRFGRVMSVLLGAGFVIGGAAMLGGAVSTGGSRAGVPADRATDAVIGGMLMLMGLAALIFRRAVVRDSTERYRRLLRMADSAAGRALYRAPAILVGAAWLYVGVAAFTGRIGGR